MYLYDEKEESKEDEEKKQKEIEALKLSIQKRETLLSNENFCKKAPEKLVEEEKKKLELEKQKLTELER